MSAFSKHSPEPKDSAHYFWYKKILNLKKKWLKPSKVSSTALIFLQKGAWPGQRAGVGSDDVRS